MHLPNSNCWTNRSVMISPSAKAYPPNDCFRFHIDLHFCSAKVPGNIKHLSLRTSNYFMTRCFQFWIWETGEQIWSQKLWPVVHRETRKKMVRYFLPVWSIKRLCYRELTLIRWISLQIASNHLSLYIWWEELVNPVWLTTITGSSKLHTLHTHFTL